MNSPEDWKKMLDTQGEGYNQRISALENLSRSLIIRIGNLESARDKRAFDEHAVKSQAAAAQATEHLYAPLRSDTKPLLEMSAFLRKVAGIYEPEMEDKQCLRLFIDVVYEAREILKRST